MYRFDEPVGQARKCPLEPSVACIARLGTKCRNVSRFPLHMLRNCLVGLRRSLGTYALLNGEFVSFRMLSQRTFACLLWLRLHQYPTRAELATSRRLAVERLSIHDIFQTEVDLAGDIAVDRCHF